MATDFNRPAGTPILGGADSTPTLRTYPNNSEARKAMRPQAKCKKAMWFAGFFSHRTRRRRKRFIRPWARSTTQLRARPIRLAGSTAAKTVRVLMRRQQRLQHRPQGIRDAKARRRQVVPRAGACSLRALFFVHPLILPLIRIGSKCVSAPLPIGVATCKHRWLSLQTSHFSAQIN